MRPSSYLSEAGGFGPVRLIAVSNPCSLTGLRPIYLDAMLGWLARWLRIIGVEVYYDSRFSDDYLSSIGGVVVTRDRGLFERRDGASIYLASSSHVEWLAAVARLMDLELTMAYSLCPLCGGRLIRVDPQEAFGKVPEHVIRLGKPIYRCASCGQYYWEGSHHRGIKATLSRANAVKGRIRVNCMDGIAEAYL